MTTITIRSENAPPSTVASLAQCLEVSPGEPVLFICPHDDDAVIGAGMVVAQAAAEGLEVHVGIASDGSMGYCSPQQRDYIIGIRKGETLKSYGVLGILPDRIHYMGYPDGALYRCIGRRKSRPGDPDISGFTGLQNSFTHMIRQIRPTRVFTPAATDLHPDHQAVYKDLLISIFHAQGDIWPELGEPCPVPKVYDYPIYVELDGLPDVMLTGDEELFDRKLEAIGCYVSQKQIKACVDGIRQAGAVEFFRCLRFGFYKPEAYKKLFE